MMRAILFLVILAALPIQAEAQQTWHGRDNFAVLDTTFTIAAGDSVEVFWSGKAVYVSAEETGGVNPATVAWRTNSDHRIHGGFFASPPDTIRYGGRHGRGIIEDHKRWTLPAGKAFTYPDPVSGVSFKSAGGCTIHLHVGFIYK